MKALVILVSLALVPVFAGAKSGKDKFNSKSLAKERFKEKLEAKERFARPAADKALFRPEPVELPHLIVGAHELIENSPPPPPAPGHSNAGGNGGGNAYGLQNGVGNPHRNGATGASNIGTQPTNPGTGAAAVVAGNPDAQTMQKKNAKNAKIATQTPGSNAQTIPSDPANGGLGGVPQIIPHANVPSLPSEQTIQATQIRYYVAKNKSGYDLIDQMFIPHLRETGNINPDGSVTAKGQAAGIFAEIPNGAFKAPPQQVSTPNLKPMATPVMAPALTPVPIVQRTPSLAQALNASSGAGGNSSQYKDKGAEAPKDPNSQAITPDSITNIPPSASGVLEYFYKHKDGSVLRLSKKDAMRLNKGKELHKPDGSLTSEATDNGLQTHNTPKEDIIQMGGEESPSEVRRLPRSDFLYFYPNESTDKSGQFHPITSTDLEKLKSLKLIYPDGSLSAKAKQLGLSSVLVVDEQVSLPESAEGIQAHIKYVNEAHDRHLKRLHGELFGPVGGERGVLNLWWLLLLLVPIFYWVNRKRKANAE